MMRRLLVCAALAACHPNSASTVIIDLSALQRHAAQARISIDRIELVVSASDLAPLVFAIDPATTTFDIEVPAGPQRSFEVTAQIAGGGGEVPAYWGVVVVDLVPRTTVDLVIPIYPSGQVQGSVQTSDGTSIPADFTVGFDLTQGPAKRPPRFEAAVNGGSFARPLPTGSYQLDAAFSANSTTYSAPPAFAFPVAQGVVTDVGVVTLAPPGQVATGAPPEGVPVGGLVSSPGLAPGAASMSSANYTLDVGAIAPLDSTPMQSAGYSLRGATEPMRRVP